MAGPIAIDTPDYQRGVFNPQLLLAAVPAGRSSVTVGVPTNAETLVVATTGIPADDLINVVGVTTGISYPGVSLPPQPRIVSTPTWMYDVSAATDSEVSVSFTSAPTATWYVYADAGTHLTVDASLVKNSVGAAYVVPSIPSPQAGDHPPNEMQCTFDFGTTTQVFMGAPGAGLRYRLFTIELTGDNTAGSWEMVASGSVDGPYIHVAGVNATVIPLHPQGYPMPADTGLTVVQDAAGGTWRGTVWHTTETV